MEEFAQAAKAVYQNFSDKQRKEIFDWFNSMDLNRDGKVSLREFMAVFGDLATAEVKRKIFGLVDRNGDGSLQFDEVITLFYMLATFSGRRSCNKCRDLIIGLYFTCVHCRLVDKADENTYDLCIPCYGGRNFAHQHTNFVDSSFLLSAMQKMIASRQRVSSQSMISPYSVAALPEPQGPSSSGTGSGRKRDQLKKILGIFVDVLSIAGSLQSVASLI